MNKRKVYEYEALESRFEEVSCSSLQGMEPLNDFALIQILQNEFQLRDDEVSQTHPHHQFSFHTEDTI